MEIKRLLDFAVKIVENFVWLVWTFATSVMIGSGIGLLLDSTFDTYPFWFHIGYILGWLEAAGEVAYYYWKEKRQDAEGGNPAG